MAIVLRSLKRRDLAVEVLEQEIARLKSRNPALARLLRRVASALTIETVE